MTGVFGRGIGSALLVVGYYHVPCNRSLPCSATPISPFQQPLGLVINSTSMLQSAVDLQVESLKNSRCYFQLLYGEDNACSLLQDISLDSEHIFRNERKFHQPCDTAMIAQLLTCKFQIHSPTVRSLKVFVLRVEVRLVPKSKHLFCPLWLPRKLAQTLVLPLTL